MARYGIIMKDVTYMKLMNICLEKSMTMGKLINVILDEYVQEEKLGIKPKCDVCGETAVMKAFYIDRTAVYCRKDFEEMKDLFKGWQPIE